ncbi:Conserved_hypothetical protein [Hexamita inflata]|uniref:Uncharacterized protein n=1 Tax=Hexamita inflata TaxID=28002 RepID=A0AA86RD86_9EUKA|nr:Conserved hypothetical protein [Hexamita inflata]
MIQLIIALIQSNEFECFNDNVQLIGIKAESQFYLTTSINTNCNRYAGQELKAVLTFQDTPLPPSMVTKTQIFDPSSGQLLVQFQLGKTEYESVMENPSAEFVISFGDQFFYPGTIPVIEHTTFDSRHCWDNVEFSIDYDYAFNISATPLSCPISSQVLVYLEYYNETWIQIPIIPTIPAGAFNGFKSGAFDTETVFFYNTSSSVDTANADLIINFVKFVKLHLNTKMRFRVYESDPALSIKQIYQIDIAKFGNALSKSCHPLAARANLQTWYTYTTLDPNLIVDCLQSIPGGKTFYARQYTYDVDQVVSDHSIFTVALQKFRTRLGIPFYFASTIEVNESRTYYFTVMIQLLDANSNMLQALYYSGVAQKSCYYDITTELYSSKICLKIFTKDNPVCRAQLSSTGIIGSFSGKLDPDPADPTKRKTYFWMKVDKKLPSSWFNSYQRVCFTDADDTGEYQGTKVGGNFAKRMKGLSDSILKNKISFTLPLITDTELYYCTKLVNSLVSSTIQYVGYIFGGMVVLVGTVLVFMQVRGKL